MSKSTYYLLQIAPTRFVHGPLMVEGYGAEKAARLTLAEAHRLYRDFCAKLRHNTPRRFPRIIRVTVETKTITQNH